MWLFPLETCCRHGFSRICTLSHNAEAQVGQQKTGPAENNCLHKLAAYKDEQPLSWDSIPYPHSPSPPSSLFPPTSFHNKLPPRLPATDLYKPSISLQSALTYLELSLSPSDALINLSCFINMAFHVPPSENLTLRALLKII